LLMRLAKIAIFLFWVSSAIRTSAQVQAPVQVGPFGGITTPLKPMKVPPELQPFVPPGKILRAVFHTQLTPSGEIIFLYDNGDGEGVFPTVYLGALQNGKTVEFFNATISAVAGLYSIQLDGHKNGLAFAYHSGGDEADTEFAIFAAPGGLYERIFYEKTMEGQMEIVSRDPPRFKLWSAAAELDPKDPERSCIWCPHRYRIKTYAWNGEKFWIVGTALTKRFLAPAPIAGNVFGVQAPTETRSKAND
jgi:hypothetical protein